jgi:hypothetical protein
MFRQISGDPLAKATAAAGNDGHFVGELHKRFSLVAMELLHVLWLDFV